MMFDVAVAGGGPAGAVTALLLARGGWRTAILEASDYEREREGETLPPEISPLLRSLDLWTPFLSIDPLESPGIVSAWGGDPQEQDFVHNAHGCGWHLDRARFDRMLCAEAVRAGAVLIPERITAVTRTDGEWDTGTLRARLLIDATGRSGLRLGPEFKRLTEDRLLVTILRVANTTPDLRTYLEATPHGWWYSSPLPNEQAIAMLFSGAPRPDWRATLVDAPLTARRLAAEAEPAVRFASAPSAIRTPLHGDGWLAAGDSASSYDPLSGLGIFKALNQARPAADAAAAWLNGQPEPFAAYAALVEAAYEAYREQRRLYYAAEQRWPRSPFWSHRGRSASKGPRREPALTS